MKRTDSGLIATSFRTLSDVTVYRPRSLAEAARIIAESEAPPALLAGGTDLVAQFNEGRAPHSILDLNGIAELRSIAIAGGTLKLGALATHDAGSADPLVRSVLPGFAAAWGKVANIRVRFVATLGGNVMARRTRYEMPILLAALDATSHFAANESIFTHAEIAINGVVAFDYDRSLRPVMTLALCVRRAGDALHARAVIGTEAMDPYVLDEQFPRADLTSLAADAPGTARAIFRRLPESVRDHSTNNAYLRGAGAALLARALVRVAHAN